MTDALATPTASELSRGEYAAQLETKVIRLKQGVGLNFLELGRLLCEVKEEEYFKELGFETITEWLSSPDVSISPGWAWNFIGLYDTYIRKAKLQPADIQTIDYTKLQMITPVVKRHPDKLDELLTKAATLRRVDLKRDLRQFKAEHGEDPEIEKERVFMTVGEMTQMVKDLEEVETVKNRNLMKVQARGVCDNLKDILAERSGIEDLDTYLSKV